MLLTVTLDENVLQNYLPPTNIQATGTRCCPSVPIFIATFTLHCKTVKFFVNPSDAAVFKEKVWSECRNGEEGWGEMLKDMLFSQTLHARITLTVLLAF